MDVLGGFAGVVLIMLVTDVYLVGGIMGMQQPAVKLRA